MSVQDSDRLIGESAAFHDALDRVSQAAPLNRPVLLVGERGTGKELFAARLHYLSARWDQPYQQINCAALSESLLESELFGHEVGAFTGATRRHAGRFERADGGTLFMDELATTSARVQEQLLRVVEYGRFERLGGRETLQTDVRLVGATNIDLPTLAAAGAFRADLLDRLSFEVITLPPLRHRAGDIVLLAEHFAINMTRELGEPAFPGFSSTAIEALNAYAWPGNVRELKNVIERSLYRHPDWTRQVETIVFDPFASPYRPSGLAPTDVPVTPRQPEKTSLKLPIDLKQHLANTEREWVAAALAESRFNQRRAAEQLGLSYHQLRAILRRAPELLES